MIEAPPVGGVAPLNELGLYLTATTYSKPTVKPVSFMPLGSGMLSTWKFVVTVPGAALQSAA
jgi:hypothetical protein